MRSQRRLVSPQSSTIILPSLYDGLIAGFHLDEISGNPIDFVGSLAPTLNTVTQGVTGKFGKCVSIDIGYVGLNTNSLLGGLSSFTFACWQKDNLNQTRNNLAGSYGGSRMYAFAQNSFNQWLGYIYVGTAIQGGSFNPPAGVNWIDYTRWYLVIFEWTGTEFRCYVDNQQSINFHSTPAGTIQKGTTETIGGSWRDGDSYKNIDEALYWNRPLTADEKTNLWNEGNGIIL